MQVSLFMAVAAGGALGSMLRYLVGIGVGRLLGPGFPWGTLLINISGSALIGALAGIFALKADFSQATRVFLTVGICGGYTTFSTFSLDAWYLVERGEPVAALGYVASSVVASFAAVAAAMWVVRVMP